MTRAEIEAMPAGRELDVAIARMMGWKEFATPSEVQRYAGTWFSNWVHDGPVMVHENDSAARMFMPCAYIGDAMEAAKKFIAEHKLWLQLRSPWISGDVYEWHAGLTPEGVTGWNGRPDIEGAGETDALAICRALLIAKEKA